MLECLVLVGLGGRLSLTSLLFFFFFFPLRRDNSGKKNPLFFPLSGCEFPKAVPRCLLLCFKEVPGDEGSGVVAPGDEQRGARGLFLGLGEPQNSAPSELLAQLGVYK